MCGIVNPFLHFGILVFDDNVHIMKEVLLKAEFSHMLFVVLLSFSCFVAFSGSAFLTKKSVTMKKCTLTSSSGVPVLNVCRIWWWGIITVWIPRLLFTVLRLACNNQDLSRSTVIGLQNSYLNNIHFQLDPISVEDILVLSSHFLYGYYVS